MDKETSAPLTATPPLRCATPKRDSLRLPARCSPTLTMKQWTSRQTMTALRKSRAFFRRDCQTCWSMDLLASPLEWPRTFRRITSAKSPTPPSPSSPTQNSPSTISASTSTRPTSLLAAFCTATTPSRIRSPAQPNVLMRCARCTHTDAVASLSMAPHTSKRRRVAIAPPSSSPNSHTR